jgi:transposase
MVKRYPKEREEQKRQIIDLYLQCLPIREIEAKLQISDSTIDRVLQKFKSEILKQPPVPESLQLYNVWNFQNRDTRYLG